MTPAVGASGAGGAQRPPTVLALVRNTGGFYHGAVLEGLAREVRAAGGRVLVAQTVHPGDDHEEHLRTPEFHVPVAWDEIDGVVVTALGGDPAYLRALQERGTPVVLASQLPDGLEAPSVLPDNRGGVAAAVAHLVAHGRTRLAFVGGDEQHDHRERRVAFGAALAAHGLAADPAHVVVAPSWSRSGGRAAAATLLALAEAPDGPGLPDAVVTATDGNALGLVAALRAAGVRVPEDVAVVGFDDTAEAALGEPALTSVTQRFDELGALAGRLVLAARDGDVPCVPHVAEAVALTPRASCGCDAAPRPWHGDGPVDDDAAPTAWRDAARAHLADAVRLSRVVREQHRVASDLVTAQASRPEALGWLARSDAPAAVLGRWVTTPGDGALEVTGVHDRTGRLDVAPGTAVDVRCFPPRALLDLVDDLPGSVCLVVPVRTAHHDWGLLAVLAEVDTASNHETYLSWAGLLCSAIEERALQASVRTSEERYAHAVAASNDGLWELDLAAGRTYLSARCREILGLDEDAAVHPDAWTAAVVPEDRAGLADAMRAALRLGRPVDVEYRITRPDGSWRWVLCRAIGVRDDDGTVVRLVGSLADVHPRKELEEQLRHGALFDPVTGLPNRRLFLDRLAVAVEQPARRPGSGYAVVFLDLDGFKLVNDSLGHLVGDELLCVVAERLRAQLRSVDTAARFGGDEFAVLLTDPDPDEVLVVARRIQEAVAAPVLLAGHEVSVTASVGVATSQTGYTDPEDVLRDADLAMYDAKATERGSASVFDPEMHARATGRLTARAEVRAALAERQFVVHYQPIVALDGSGLDHFEALVRWQHPTRGLLLPGAFLPAMEDDLSVVPLGRWLLDEVCRQVAAWRSGGCADGADGPDGPDGPGTPQVAVSVNLSHHEFWSDGLVDAVRGALARHGVPARCLVVEITESVIMTDLERARAVMAQLKDAGVRLHVDDFGTGHSSLHALRSFPVDALKIDGSFVREMGTVAQTSALVRVIVEMARVLGLDVVAECVETPDQARALRAMGCGNAQGWLYARALPGDEAGAMLGAPLAAEAETSATTV